MVGMRYVFKCDQCSAESESDVVRVELDYRWELPRPHLPNGWTTFMELLLCEKHEVKYEITNG